MNIFEYKKYGLSILRVSLGLLFFIAGLLKLSNPSVIIGMVHGLGFPTPFDIYVGLLVMLFELAFGFTVLVGFNVKLSVIPLMVITVVAAVGVHVPRMNGGAMIVVIIFMHLVTIAALIHIALNGSGPYSVEEKWNKSYEYDNTEE